MAILVTGQPGRAGGGIFQAENGPKMAINRTFPGLHAFSANFARDKMKERETPDLMVQNARGLGPLEPF